MASLAVLIGIVLSSELFVHNFSLKTTFLALLVAFVVTGAGNTINDFFDYETDKLNAPTRPIPAGEIKKKNAFYLSISLFAIGVSLSLLINLACFLLALINSLVLYLYARNLKGVPLLGNFSVGYLVGSTFLFGALVVGEIKTTFVLFLLATFSTLGREIAKDIEDISGDMGEVKTIATEFGKNLSSYLAASFTLIAVFLSPTPFLLNYLGHYYLFSVLIADALFIVAIKILLANRSEDSAFKFQKTSKYAMLIALISFLVGSFGIN